MTGSLPHDTQSKRAQGLDRLYDQLSKAVDYVRNPDLQADINDWLKQVEQLPEADALDYIERRLSLLRQRTSDDETTVGQFDMYRSGDDGDAEFPADCEGCDHYGVACPIFTKNVERDRRERLKRDLEDASPTRVKTEFRQLAQDNGCHVLPDIIEDYDTQYADLLRKGRDLYQRKNVHVGKTTEAGEVGQALDEATDEEASP